MDNIEIKVGQVWRTRNGNEVKITDVYADSEGFAYPVIGDDSYTRTKYGAVWSSADPSDGDLAELIRDYDGAEVMRVSVETADKTNSVAVEALKIPHHADAIGHIIVTGINNGHSVDAIREHINLYREFV